MASDPPAWWASLRHGGLLIAPSRLGEFFAGAPEPLPDHLADRLRRDVLRLEAGTADAEAALLDVVLHRVCGLEAREGHDRWERGSDVDARWSIRAPTGEIVKPRRVWYGAHDSRLPVFVDAAPRLGIGHGRRAASRVLYWLRASQHKLALLTNAHQWRLIYAGLDFDAWAEWDIALWFEEGRPGAQVAALRALLSRRALAAPGPNQAAPLLAAIEASRKGQAELSSELGERVRRAVELLIRALSTQLEGLDQGVTPRDIYIAATRLVMRMVVVLFAEARDLLPRADETYHASYGLQGLRELLERAAGGASRERLNRGLGAWPRMLGLFRLVHAGSHHAALPVPRYGGDLFAPGDPASSDPVMRALAALEAPGAEHPPTDVVVHEVLELLCRSRVRVRQGRASTWVDAPVDFSDLSSEYIGILYEGLLDYELRRACEPLAFLALGDEPLLPLARVEAMRDADLGPLVEKLKVKDKSLSGKEDAEGVESGDDDTARDEAEDEEAGAEDAAVDATQPAVPVFEDESDARQAAHERAWAWARRAVAAGHLVAKPRSKEPEAQRAYADEVGRVARRLVPRVVLPGEWFLVRWGGTRKGAGTFYTRPQLAVPTVQRTLRPLAFEPPLGADGQPDEDAPPARWTPRRPEEILALKVCDPAAGSGSFLIASLRFLTEALYLALHHHGRIRAHGDTTLVTLAEGRPSDGSLSDDPLPCRPDADEFEPRLRARLKRYVVERCLYGVDIDPLAVELARLALWIETMDRDLPFEFLDHKIRPGNALVGCWFDRFRDYPALAWEREGGDKGHSNGVSFEKETWTRAIKAQRNDQIKAELAAWILGQRSLLDSVEGRTPEAIHDDALAAFAQMHGLPIHAADERAQLYRDKLQRDPALARLRASFDTWCAVWFWPADDLAHAPTPRTFEAPPEDTRARVADLARRHRFFHWELEFPDVFAQAGGGFDALVGNPPWEIQKPNSKEHFSNLDPLYRTYGKQHALDRQRKIFAASAHDERGWLDYNARLKALSNWVKHAGEPFGDALGEPLFLGKAKADIHARSRERREGRRGGYSDRQHPFLHQGSADVNTYKLFLELAHALLRPGGLLGMLVPSGVYTDKGSTDLRTLFLNHCRWRWLFGFENRDRIFDIHRSFKFGPVIVQKGGRTEAIRTAFMRRDIDDWADAERIATEYSMTFVSQSSPTEHFIWEICHERDFETLRIILSESTRLGTQFPAFSREFHKTYDSGAFSTVAWAREHGLIPAGSDVRCAQTRKRLLQAGWVAVWEGKTCAFDAWLTEPEFICPLNHAAAFLYARPAVGIRRVARGTDERTIVTCLVPPNTPTLYSILLPREIDVGDVASLFVTLSSFAVDFVVRQQVATSLIAAQVRGLPYPSGREFRGRAARLLLRLLSSGSLARQAAARCTMDVVVAASLALAEGDMAWILRDCDHPAVQLREKAFVRTLDPRGFWRVDNDKDPELRHTVLTLVAFHDLARTIAAHGGDRERGIDAFCSQHDGDGWMLPETLRLADYGLGHDERAQRHQPVRERLGPRFLPWPLEQSAEESWAECERHARNILGDEGFERLQAETRGEPPANALDVPRPGDVPRATGHEPPQRTLFPSHGTPTDRAGSPPGDRRR